MLLQPQTLHYSYLEGFDLTRSWFSWSHASGSGVKAVLRVEGRKTTGSRKRNWARRHLLQYYCRQGCCCDESYTLQNPGNDRVYCDWIGQQTETLHLNYYYLMAWKKYIKTSCSATKYFFTGKYSKKLILFIPLKSKIIFTRKITPVWSFHLLRPWHFYHSFTKYNPS